jgi:hypothetical protein
MINPTIKEDIINVVRIASHYNEPLAELWHNLEEHLATAAPVEGPLRDAILAGGGIWESLAKKAPQLADAIHDVVYQVTNPHNSIVKREQAKDLIIRDLFSL